MPPWRWKFGLLLSRSVHTVVRIVGSALSFSVRTCPAVSIRVGTSHKTAKNLCERDALSTELYPHFLRSDLNPNFRARQGRRSQKVLINSPISPPI